MRNKTEEERDQLIEDLTSRNQDLSQFAYITSHNLRAPLSNLIGLIDILNYDLFVLFQTEHLGQIINGFVQLIC